MKYNDEFLMVDTPDFEVKLKENCYLWSKKDIEYMTEKSCIRISDKLKEINFPRKVIIFVSGHEKSAYSDFGTGCFNIKLPLQNDAVDTKYIIIHGNTNLAKESHLPLTPWITIHRCAHAMQVGSNYTPKHSEEPWEKYILGRSIPRELLSNHFEAFSLMLTTKSRKFIKNAVDFEAELITQYLHNGYCDINVNAGDYKSKLDEYISIIDRFCIKYHTSVNKFNKFQELKKVYQYIGNKENQNAILEIFNERVKNTIQSLDSDKLLFF